MQDGDTRSVPAFPEIEARLGYNPARYLDTPDRARIGETSPLATAQALIRGIDDLATIRAWIEVEVALGRGTDGGPRKQVIKRLNQRQAALQAIDTQTNEEHETGQAHESSPDEPTEPISDEPPLTAAAPPTESTETTTTTTTGHEEPALAADGGTTAATTPMCPTCHNELDQGDLDGDPQLWCASCRTFINPDNLALTEQQA